MAWETPHDPVAAKAETASRGTAQSGALAVALAGGLVALAYGVGATVMIYRYKGFGLPAQRLIGVTPRELLLVRGADTLIYWSVVGAGLFGVARWLQLHLVERPEQNGDRALRMTKAAAIVLICVLALTAHVFWPLWLVAVVLLTVLLAVRYPDRKPQRAAAFALAIAVVALSYERSRLTYGTEWSTATLRDPAGTTSGVLIGQADGGLYLGVDRGRAEKRLTAVFVPAARVVSLETTSQTRRVDAPTAKARREPIRARMWHLIRHRADQLLGI